MQPVRQLTKQHLGPKHRIFYLDMAIVEGEEEGEKTTLSWTTETWKISAQTGEEKKRKMIKIVKIIKSTKNLQSKPSWWTKKKKRFRQSTQRRKQFRQNRGNRRFHVHTPPPRCFARARGTDAPAARGQPCSYCCTYKYEQAKIPSRGDTIYHYVPKSKHLL